MGKLVGGYKLSPIEGEVLLSAYNKLNKHLKTLVDTQKKFNPQHVSCGLTPEEAKELSDDLREDVLDACIANYRVVGVKITSPTDTSPVINMLALLPSVGLSYLQVIPQLYDIVCYEEDYNINEYVMSSGMNPDGYLRFTGNPMYLKTIKATKNLNASSLVREVHDVVEGDVGYDERNQSKSIPKVVRFLEDRTFMEFYGAGCNVELAMIKGRGVFEFDQLNIIIGKSGYIPVNATYSLSDFISIPYLNGGTSLRINKWKNNMSDKVLLDIIYNHTVDKLTGR